MAEKINYNKGNNISSVAFMFACPGQKEQEAGRVVAGKALIAFSFRFIKGIKGFIQEWNIP